MKAITDGDAGRRTEALARLREHLRTALHLLGAADSWPLDAVTAVYEDRATASAPPLAAHHRAALRQFAEGACDALRVSDAYASMVAAFVSRFGPAGVCEHVFGFCRDLAGTGWPYAATATVEPTAPARPGRSSCLPSVAVLCQTVDEGAGHMPDGTASVVVNRLSSGTGGLIARFHRLMDGPVPAKAKRAAPDTAFADELRSWLRTLYPQARLLEFVPAWNANPLQEDSCGLLPALHWPTGPRRWGPGTSVDALRLVHDPERGSLELQEADGTPVAPVYLGIVPQHLLSGAARALTVLADPWWVPAHLADATAPGADTPAGRAGGCLAARRPGPWSGGQPGGWRPPPSRAGSRARAWRPSWSVRTAGGAPAACPPRCTYGRRRIQPPRRATGCASPSGWRWPPRSAWRRWPTWRRVPGRAGFGVQRVPARPRGTRP